MIFHPSGTSPGGLWLSEESAQESEPLDTGDEPVFGLVVSGLGIKSKQEAAIRFYMELHGVSQADATAKCPKQGVVPFLKKVTKGEAESVAAKLKAAGLTCRVTGKSRRKRR